MTRITIPAYSTDSRGNRLQTWAARNVGATGRVRLYVAAPAAVGQQLRSCLTAQGARTLPVPPELEPEYTDCFEMDGPLPSELEMLLALLGEVLTLEVASEVDAAFALDFYKVPPTEQAPDVWTNTAAGALVSQAKHQGDPKVQETAQREISRRLGDVVKRHPWLRTVDAVVSIPGSKTRYWSPGERIALKLANELDVPMVRTTGRHAERPQAKARGEEDYEAPEDLDMLTEFTVDLTPRQKSVIVVDDVYRTGTTMRGVAAAARRGGAETVYGLVCARTLRNR
jgi:predicted amidophosphoribosyltransferase